MSFFKDWVNTGSFSGAYFMRVTGTPLARMVSIWEAPHHEQPGVASTGAFIISMHVDERANRMLPGLADTMRQAQEDAARAWREAHEHRDQIVREAYYPRIPPIPLVTPLGYRGVPQWDDPIDRNQGGWRGWL